MESANDDGYWEWLKKHETKRAITIIEGQIEKLKKERDELYEQISS